MPPLAGEAEPASTLWYRIDERDDAIEVALGGDLDEHADFAELRARLRGRVVLVLAEVRRINSCGVREWVNFLRELPPAVSSVELVACSPAVVNQLSTISNFRGGASVRSLLAPYVCERCDVEETRLVELAPRAADRGPRLRLLPLRGRPGLRR